MSRVVIAIVGMPGAGKTETAEYFRVKGYPVLRFGDQTDIGLKKLGKELNQDNERWYREKLRSELGMAAYAIKIKPRIEAIENREKVVVLDGLYSWEEYQYLEKEYSNLLTLCIYANPDTRYKRLLNRNHRGLDVVEARKRDVAELENLNKGGPIAMADYLIVNVAGIEKLHERLDKFISTINNLILL